MPDRSSGPTVWPSTRRATSSSRTRETIVSRSSPLPGGSSKASGRRGSGQASLTGPVAFASRAMASSSSSTSAIIVSKFFEKNVPHQVPFLNLQPLREREREREFPLEKYELNWAQSVKQKCWKAVVVVGSSWNNEMCCTYLGTNCVLTRYQHFA